MCSKSVAHRASKDPGRKQAGIPPHGGTRADKLLLEQERVREEVGSWSERQLCKESSFPGPGPERSVQAPGVSLWAPRRESATGVRKNVIHTHFRRIVDAELARGSMADMPGLLEIFLSN